VSSTRVDGRLLLKVAADVTRLLDRVTELENSRRTDSAAIARHSEQIEALAKALSEGDEEIEERTMIQ
jgi:hypothetical protein